MHAGRIMGACSWRWADGTLVQEWRRCASGVHCKGAGHERLPAADGQDHVWACSVWRGTWQAQDHGASSAALPQIASHAHEVGDGAGLSWISSLGSSEVVLSRRKLVVVGQREGIEDRSEWHGAWHVEEAGGHFHGQG
eukprot:9041048-Pyramimonas_sp.AAC.1